MFWVVSANGIRSLWRALSHMWLLSSPPHLFVSTAYLQAFFQFSVLQTFSSSFKRVFIHCYSWLGLDFSLSPSVILVLPLLWLASQCAWLFVATSKGMNSKHRCSLFLPVWTRCCLMLRCLKLIRQCLHSQRRLQGELLGEEWLLQGQASCPLSQKGCRMSSGLCLFSQYEYRVPQMVPDLHSSCRAPRLRGAHKIPRLLQW